MLFTAFKSFASPKKCLTGAYKCLGIHGRGTLCEDVSVYYTQNWQNFGDFGIYTKIVYKSVRI